MSSRLVFGSSVHATGGGEGPTGRRVFKSINSDGGRLLAHFADPAGRVVVGLTGQQDELELAAAAADGDPQLAADLRVVALEQLVPGVGQALGQLARSRR